MLTAGTASAQDCVVNGMVLQRLKFFFVMLSLLAAWASPALAHTEARVPAGLASGFLHPLSGLDHLVAMVAVGLWGARLGSPAI